MDATILESVKATEIEAEIQEAGEFAAQIHQILVKFDTVLHVNETAPYSGSPSVNTGNSNEHSHGATASACKPKLPKLSLRKFYGDPTSWMPWWDSFNSAVHSNESLSSADKFNYLRSLLDGQAASAIAGLQLTAKNYEDAIEILRSRYGNKQIIISSYMDILLNLPVVTSLSDIRRIRYIYDKIESRVRGLQGLGINPDSYDNLLIPIMLSKLPDELRLIISRKFPKNVWNIDLLLQEFGVELEARERVVLLTSNVSNKYQTVKPKPPIYEHKSNNLRH